MGDEVLKNIAEAIIQTYGNIGKCYRIGGDEFCAIISKEVRNMDSFNEIFTQKLNEMRKIDSRMTTVSIGMSNFVPDRENFSTALSRADEELYKIKSSKKEVLQ